MQRCRGGCEGQTTRAALRRAPWRGCSPVALRARDRQCLAWNRGPLGRPRRLPGSAGEEASAAGGQAGGSGDAPLPRRGRGCAGGRSRSAEAGGRLAAPRGSTGGRGTGRAQVPPPPRRPGGRPGGAEGKAAGARRERARVPARPYPRRGGGGRSLPRAAAGLGFILFSGVLPHFSAAFPTFTRPHPLTHPPTHSTAISGAVPRRAAPGEAAALLSAPLAGLVP